MDHGVEERDIITDKATGANLEREGYTALKRTILREGDTLVVQSLDRLSRSKSDIKTELEFYKQSHIRLKVLDIPTTLIELESGQDWVFEMINNILIEVLSSIAEQERITIKQRQAEGIAAAKRKGKHLGRPGITYPNDWENVFDRWITHEITAVAAMEQLQLKRTTFYKLVKEYTSE